MPTERDNPDACEYWRADQEMRQMDNFFFKTDVKSKVTLEVGITENRRHVYLTLSTENVRGLSPLSTLMTEGDAFEFIRRFQTLVGLVQAKPPEQEEKTWTTD